MFGETECKKRKRSLVLSIINASISVLYKITDKRRKRRKRFFNRLFPVYSFHVSLPPMSSKLEHIIQKARSIFMRCGIRSVTMDDVCKEMRISKKTLYQYVHDKTDLVNQTMRSEIEKDEEEITRLIQGGHNAIDEMFEITQLVSKKVQDIHPSILYDMQKYYPEAWEMMRVHRNDFIEKVIISNIAKGQAEGNYRENLLPAIVARLFASKMDVLSDKQFISDTGYTLLQINSEHLTYHLHGIVTPKGNQYLEHKRANSNSPSI